MKVTSTSDIIMGVDQDTGLVSWSPLIDERTFEELYRGKQLTSAEFVEYLVKYTEQNNYLAYSLGKFFTECLPTAVTSAFLEHYDVTESYTKVFTTDDWIGPDSDGLYKFEIPATEHKVVSTTSDEETDKSVDLDTEMFMVTPEGSREIFQTYVQKDGTVVCYTDDNTLIGFVVIRSAGRAFNLASATVSVNQITGLASIATVPVIENLMEAETRLLGPIRTYEKNFAALFLDTTDRWPTDKDEQPAYNELVKYAAYAYRDADGFDIRERYAFQSSINPLLAQINKSFTTAEEGTVLIAKNATNADNATNATNDANGNLISGTYATKTEHTNAIQTLEDTISTATQNLEDTIDDVQTTLNTRIQDTAVQSNNSLSSVRNALKNEVDRVYRNAQAEFNELKTYTLPKFCTITLRVNLYVEADRIEQNVTFTGYGTMYTNKDHTRYCHVHSLHYHAAATTVNFPDVAYIKIFIHELTIQGDYLDLARQPLPKNVLEGGYLFKKSHDDEDRYSSLYVDIEHDRTNNYIVYYAENPAEDHEGGSFNSGGTPGTGNHILITNMIIKL